MSNNIYRLKWTDINTGDDLKFDITDGDPTALTGSPTIINLDSDCLIDTNIKWDWSNKYYGVQQLDLSLKLLLNRLPLSAAPMMTRPFVNYSYYYVDWTLPTVFGFNIPLTLSNVWNLYRNNVFVCSFIQKSGITSGINTKTSEFDVALVPLFRAVTEAMEYKYLEELWQVPDGYIYATKAIYSICKKDGAENIAIGVTTTAQNNYDDRFWFIDYDIVDYFIQNLYNAIHNKFVRTENITYLETNLIDLPVFYKQRYDGNETPEIIANSERKLLGWVTSGDLTGKAARTKYDSIWVFLQDKFSNFYNFIKDNANNYGLRYYADGSLERLLLNTSSDELSPEMLIGDLEIALSAEVIKNANASLFLSYGDDNDNIRLDTNASYAEGSVTLPVTFNNIPNALSYERYAVNLDEHSKKFGLLSSEVVYRGFDINWLGIYYKDRPYSNVAGEYITIANEILLADNYAVCYLGASVDTTNALLSPISYVDANEGNALSTYWTKDCAKDACIAIQAYSCVTNAMLNAVSYLFGQDSQTVITGEVLHNVMDGTASPWFWMMPKNELYVNLNDYDIRMIGTLELAGLFTGLSNKFTIIECDMSFLGHKLDGSKAKFKAVSRELVY